MKLKNISIGDFIEAKNKHGGDVGFDVLEIGKSYEVLGFNEDSDLTVIISVPEHKTFRDGFYVCHECFRKPRPKLKQLDQSVFDGLDENWRFAAVDGNKGFPIVYEFEPYAFESGKYYTNRHGLYKDLTHLTGYDASNWQNSLIERDIAKELLEVDLSSELTGSDLARAMLERGDRFVMCMVANNEANMFLATRPVVVHGCTDSDFISISGCYSFAVAVNNQGEPLTAAEAGL